MAKGITTVLDTVYDETEARERAAYFRAKVMAARKAGKGLNVSVIHKQGSFDTALSRYEYHIMMTEE